LNRVIYVGSYSKTLCASLRVGFLAAHADLANSLADLKMLSGVTTSELSERIVYKVLMQGRPHKQMERLRERLAKTIGPVCARLEASGLSLYHEPQGGMFVWARLPEGMDATALARQAVKASIILAPGNVFSPNLAPSPWLRFNVASVAIQGYTGFWRRPRQIRRRRSRQRRAAFELLNAASSCLRSSSHNLRTA
jgi:DNA-binding transcriptional MocR family regulator